MWSAGRAVCSGGERVPQRRRERWLEAVLDGDGRPRRRSVTPAIARTMSSAMTVAHDSGMSGGSQTRPEAELAGKRPGG